MRRLVAPLSVLALVAALLNSGGVTAQEASPEAMPMAWPAAVPEPLTRVGRSLGGRRCRGHSRCVHRRRSTYEEVPIGVVTHGQDELRAHLEGRLSAFPDLSLVVTKAFVAGDWAAEWTVTMTYSGQFPGMPPDRGQCVSVTGATILALEGDKSRADREYWDAYAFLIALGALPAPETTGTPTA